MDLEDATLEAGIKHENIQAVKSILEQAIKNKARELRDKCGVEHFRDQSLQGLERNAYFDYHLLRAGVGLDSFKPEENPENQLFFYLARKQNILEDDTILYIANVLFNYAKQSYIDFRKLGEDQYAEELTENLFKEIEALLSKPLSNSFGRAYQTYLSGKIELFRADVLEDKYPEEETTPEVEKEISDHHTRAIRFLEESVYYSTDIADAGVELLNAYYIRLARDFDSTKEKEDLQGRFERLDAKHPEHMKEIRKIMSEFEQG